jgi:SAM-dependent methyltransferase
MTGVGSFDGSTYQARFDALAAEGVDVHGEAHFVMGFGPRTVLDAGCGTGRVSLELARRGVDVVGVDVDRSMLAEARRRAPEPGAVTWVEADLARLELGRSFDVVLLAGNVPLFCPESDRPALLAACARHVAPGGVLIAGFQLDGRYALEDWDLGCQEAGLVPAERWSTWDREPSGRGARPSGYAVSVHRRPPA